MPPTTTALHTKHSAGQQLLILEFIATHTASRGYPPSVREIGDAAGIASSSVTSYQLRILQRAGYLHITPHTARAITLRAP